MSTNTLFRRVILVLLIGVFFILPAIPAQANSLAAPAYAGVSGDLLWAKRMGGTGSDGSQDMAVDSSGKIYLTGGFQGTADFDPGPGVVNLTAQGQEDAFISKLDSHANFLWAKDIGGTATSGSYGYSITVDLSGNVYITGTFSDTVDFDPGAGIVNLTSVGGSDTFILKLDNNGNFIWVKALSGLANQLSRDVAVDANGNVYTVGEFMGTADFDPGAGVANLTSAGEDDAFVSKLDDNGDFVWAKRIGAAQYDLAYGLTLDSSGNVYVTGGFYETVDFNPGAGVFNLISAGGYDAFVLKLDSSGGFVLAKRLGGANTDFGYKIALDANGNIHTTGYFFGTGDYDPGPGVANLTSLGSYDVYISKLTATGSYVWAKSVGGGGWDNGYDIAVAANGDVYTTGTFRYLADFDPGPGTLYFNSAGWGDVFVLKLDKSGKLVWARQMGGADNDEGHGLGFDAHGNLYISGFFFLTADFLSGPGAVNLTSAGSSDIFVVKLLESVATTIIQSIAAQDGWTLESGEASSRGGAVNAGATTIWLGDNAARRQYRGILSFGTGSSLPDNAVITGITLKLTKQSVVGGGNPLSVFQGLIVDVKNGSFDLAGLQAGDFQSAASKSFGPFNPTLVSNRYIINLAAAKGYINKLSTNGGLTQLRLRFKLDDNNDPSANYLSLYSGNAATSSRPQLLITYYIP